MLRNHFLQHWCNVAAPGVDAVIAEHFLRAIIIEAKGRDPERHRAKQSHVEEFLCTGRSC